MPNTPTPSADARSFTVTVDFGYGDVIGFAPLAEAIVEFIQEDRVTAGDDIAQVCAEVLAHYLATGDVDDSHQTLLATAVATN
jgi:hypothetical protein